MRYAITVTLTLSVERRAESRQDAAHAVAFDLERRVDAVLHEMGAERGDTTYRVERVK